jgi:hypothetical protein
LILLLSFFSEKSEVALEYAIDAIEPHHHLLVVASALNGVPCSYLFAHGLMNSSFFPLRNRELKEVTMLINEVQVSSLFGIVPVIAVLVV